MNDESNDLIERIVVLDRRAFGLKVMEWADESLPVPTNMAEAEEQLEGILEFPLPAYITSLEFIKTTKEVWTIKVPPADMLEDTRERIRRGEDYEIDDYYYQRVNGDLPDDLKLFEFRVGDYTCALCA